MSWECKCPSLYVSKWRLKPLHSRIHITWKICITWLITSLISPLLTQNTDNHDQYKCLVVLTYYTLPGTFWRDTDLCVFSLYWLLTWLSNYMYSLILCRQQHVLLSLFATKWLICPGLRLIQDVNARQNMIL